MSTCNYVIALLQENQLSHFFDSAEFFALIIQAIDTSYFWFGKGQL